MITELLDAQRRRHRVVGADVADMPSFKNVVKRILLPVPLELEQETRHVLPRNIRSKGAIPFVVKGSISV